MIRPLSFLVVCLVALVGVAGSANATAKDKLQEIQSQIDHQQQQQAVLDQKAEETSETLNLLRQKLIQATEAMQTKAGEDEQLRDRLEQLAHDILSKKTALVDEREKLAMVTAALIEISRQPPETLFLQTALTTDHIHRSIMLRAVLPRIKEQAETMAHDLVVLNDLKAQMARQERLVAAAEENMQLQQRELDQMIRTRQGLLQRTETQKQAIAKELVSLSNEAKDLRQLLDKITPKRSLHARPLAPLNAVLRQPVAGSLTHGYGTRDADDVVSQGLTYASLPGSPVVAPTAGRVVFAGPFRGYGQIVILQHASGYHSFLAGFGRIDADMGQDVEAGEPLGVLPAKAGERPELYFELRHNNEPINPTSGGISLSQTISGSSDGQKGDRNRP